MVNYDVIVLGSGNGGMTAGLTLSRRGFSVLVLEAGKAYGGMMNPFSRKQFTFDIGLHYIGDCGEGQLLRTLFDHLGLEDLRFREISPEAIDRYVFPSTQGVLRKGIAEWIEELRRQFPAEEKGLRRFEKLLEAVSATAAMGSRGLTARGLLDIARMPLPLARSLRVDMKTILDAHFRDANLKNILGGPCGDAGVPPSRMTGFVGLALLTHFLGGGYYPLGGTRAWRDAFVDGMKKDGAELLRNQEVVSIRVNVDGTFTVRTAKEKEFTARSVVSNIDAEDTLSMLEGARPNWFARRKVNKMRPSIGTVCVFLGVDMDLRETRVTDANIWHYPTDDLDELFRDVTAGDLSDDPFFFLTSPTLKDPDGGKAPAGYHTLELITGASGAPFKRWFDRKTTRRGDTYESLKNELADSIVESAERHYLPGLREHIVLREVSTPATNHSYVRSRAGGIYGPEFSHDQTFLGRFLPAVGIPGLYLAGASTFGPGVMTCTVSGFVAGKLAARYLGEAKPVISVPREVRRGERSFA